MSEGKDSFEILADEAGVNVETIRYYQRRGLMAEPKLLILDEPSLGLSPLLVEEMFTLIGQLKSSGLAVLLVEQNVGQSLEIADRAYVMENGLIRFTGKPAELLASDTLRQAYLGM